MFVIEVPRNGSTDYYVFFFLCMFILFRWLLFYLAEQHLLSPLVSIIITTNCKNAKLASVALIIILSRSNFDQGDQSDQRLVNYADIIVHKCVPMPTQVHSLIIPWDGYQGVNSRERSGGLKRSI